jgi:hypothetical protein
MSKSCNLISLDREGWGGGHVVYLFMYLSQSTTFINHFHMHIYLYKNKCKIGNIIIGLSSCITMYEYYLPSSSYKILLEKRDQTVTNERKEIASYLSLIENFPSV